MRWQTCEMGGKSRRAALAAGHGIYDARLAALRVAGRILPGGGWICRHVAGDTQGAGGALD